MSVRLFPALCLMIVAGTALAAEVPRFTKGEPYADYRKRLLSVHGFGVMTESPLDKNRCSPGRDECQRFSETIYCSGSGLATCVFIVLNKDKNLRIETYGEDALVKSARFISDAQFQREALGH